MHFSLFPLLFFLFSLFVPFPFSFLFLLFLFCVVLPDYMYQLTGEVSSDTEIGVLFALYSAGLLIASPLIGFLSDRYGRRWLMIIGLISLSIASTGFAYAPEVMMLYCARFVQGLGPVPLVSFFLPRFLVLSSYRDSRCHA